MLALRSSPPSSSAARYLGSPPTSSNKPSSVSVAPLVVMVYLREVVGFTTKSACSPDRSSSGIDSNGESDLVLPVAPGYQRSIQALSDAESSRADGSPFTS